MSRAVTLSDLVTDTLELSGRGSQTPDARAIRAVQRAIVWVWREMAKGWDGFATRETEIQTAATGDSVSLLAGQGGANRPDGTPTDPIVRGVFRLRGVYRPLSSSSDQRYPVQRITRGAYYDLLAPRLDTSTTARPGFYWLDQREDASADLLVLRPPLEGSELIRVIYTPTAPVPTALTDTIEGLNNAEDAIHHRAGYYLLRSQDRKHAGGLNQEAVVLVNDCIEGYSGERDQGGPRLLENYKRGWGGPTGRGYG